MLEYLLVLLGQLIFAGTPEGPETLAQLHTSFHLKWRGGEKKTFILCGKNKKEISATEFPNKSTSVNLN